MQPATPLQPVAFPGPAADGAPFWQPGSPVPAGYRIRYRRDNRLVLGGGGALALSYTVTTLISSAIVATGFPGIFIGPIGTIPLVGPYPMAAFAAANRAGVGTTAAILALGVTQAVGFGVMVYGIVKKTPVGVTPICDDDELPDTSGLTISPQISPTSGGVSISLDL